jgi:hypothetical protein
MPGGFHARGPPRREPDTLDFTVGTTTGDASVVEASGDAQPLVASSAPAALGEPPADCAGVVGALAGGSPVDGALGPPRARAAVGGLFGGPGSLGGGRW